MGEKYYCKFCGEVKSKSYKVSEYCKKCRGERAKLITAENRVAKGLSPQVFKRSGGCKIENCNKKIVGKQLCSAHYARLRKHGSPLIKVIKSANLNKYDFYKNYEMITETGCWIWLKYTDKDGYGASSVMVDGKKKILKAHRVSYELFNGVITDNAHVLHRCDTPSCVNPQHLFLGTNKINMIDKVNKNRQSRGSVANVTKLTEKDVLRLKSLKLKRGDIRKLAREYNVLPDTIAYAISGKTWKHVGVGS